MIPMDYQNGTKEENFHPMVIIVLAVYLFQQQQKKTEKKEWIMNQVVCRTTINWKNILTRGRGDGEKSS